MSVFCSKAQKENDIIFKAGFTVTYFLQAYSCGSQNSQALYIRERFGLSCDVVGFFSRSDSCVSDERILSQLHIP